MTDTSNMTVEELESMYLRLQIAEIALELKLVKKGLDELD